MKIKLIRISGVALIGVIAISVVGCQGSNLGSSLENAIAPASPSNSETIAEKSEQPVEKPNSSATIPVNSANIGDRLSSQMQEIALASLTLTTPKTERISIKSLFYINFDNPQFAIKQFNEFSDLATAPDPLRDLLQDLNKLGTITPKTGQEFSPNILVSRREYSRWLLETNNRLYQNQPSRQIRLAEPTDSPTFPDIPNKHPDFAVIQGLANAGLITGDRFRPNDPLLREELVQWKIPLDLRQPLPNATLETINQSWGFKDGDRISENALGAIFADSQLRDLSNIRRSFGFTTLLQPQKPVTRAEAAASLWYFGTATDGISVRKALENK
jgi:hypothetical protein